MPGLLKKLQNKPYEAKIRILWIAIIITAVFLVIIWFLTLKFRKTANMNQSPFSAIKENLQKLKDVKFGN